VGAAGQLLWAEGFGYADLDKKILLAPHHRFRIGTASKVLTTAAAGLLIEQGKLKLDEEIQNYVPAYPDKQWPVTLRHVMGHLSGIPHEGGDESPLYKKHCEKPVDALSHFADIPLRFEPATKFFYSSLGWVLVSAAIESASGKPFNAFMRDSVFAPLGMNDTYPESLTQPVPHRVTFYFPRFAANPQYGLQLIGDPDYSCFAGSSIFVSTPSDLVRFGLAMNEAKLLTRSTLQSLQSSQRLRSGEETGYGLGWYLETIDIAGQPTQALGHDGETFGGMVASLRTVPSRGLAVAVTSSTSYSKTDALAARIAAAFAASIPPKK
jgi:CubicO group peptidase (beta-lactamase class C family)